MRIGEEGSGMEDNIYVCVGIVGMRLELYFLIILKCFSGFFFIEDFFLSVYYKMSIKELYNVGVEGFELFLYFVF